MAYIEQQYPCTVDVAVTFCMFGETWTIVDSIKGLNPGHALYRARWNWDTSEIEVLTIH